MLTVPICSKPLESRPPCAPHMEKTWSLLIMETTVSMWQLAYTHLLEKACLFWSVPFYHFAFVIIIFAPVFLFFPVCHTHGGNSLIRTALLCVDAFVTRRTQPRPMRHSGLPLPQPLWNSHSCWEDYTHTRQVCALVEELDEEKSYRIYSEYCSFRYFLVSSCVSKQQIMKFGCSSTKYHLFFLFIWVKVTIRFCLTFLVQIMNEGVNLIFNLLLYLN